MIIMVGPVRIDLILSEHKQTKRPYQIYLFTEKIKFIF